MKEVKNQCANKNNAHFYSCKVKIMQLKLQLQFTQGFPLMLIHKLPT